MATSTTVDQLPIQPVRSLTPGPVQFRSPQPRRFFSTNRISRRRASSTSNAHFNDVNRRAILDEAVRRAHQTPPLDEIPGLEEEVLPGSTLPIPDYPLDISAPSLSSSACSTPSAAAFGLYSSGESLSLPTSVTASTYPSPTPIVDFSNALDFMMPAQYGHQYPSYPPGYPQGLSGSEYGADEKPSLTDLSDHPASYPPSYAASPAITGSSPAPLGSRAGSVEGDAHSESYYPTYSYSSAPMNAPTSGYSYPTTTSIPTSLPYSTTAVPSDMYLPYSSQSRYLSSHGNYLPGHGHLSTIDPGAVTQGGERVVDPPRESRCWDHGCNGRAFSTHSNFLRHQREKNGQASKSSCPRCGAMFTRKTAMNGHMLHEKCKRRSGYSSSSERSGTSTRDR